MWLTPFLEFFVKFFSNFFLALPKNGSILSLFFRAFFSLSVSQKWNPTLRGLPALLRSKGEFWREIQIWKYATLIGRAGAAGRADLETLSVALTSVNKLFFACHHQKVFVTRGKYVKVCQNRIFRSETQKSI